MVGTTGYCVSHNPHPNPNIIHSNTFKANKEALVLVCMTSKYVIDSKLWRSGEPDSY